MKNKAFINFGGTGSRNQAPMFLLLMALLLASMHALAQGNEEEKPNYGVELIMNCPCTLEKTGPNTFDLRLEIKNRGYATSGGLELEVTISLVGIGLAKRAEIPLQPLAPGASIDRSMPIQVTIPDLEEYLKLGTELSFNVYLTEAAAYHVSKRREWGGGSPSHNP